ncbi:MAG: AsmA-like C-terminal region-containing protein [Bacteroidota bacterium]
MKKFLKITGAILMVFLALLIILPVVFKGRIAEQVKVAINKNVNAEVDFGTFRLSFLRSFPDLTFRLNELYVGGVDHFEGDTLAAVSSTFVTIDLMSLFGSGGYEIKSIRVDQPHVMLKVLEDGRVNWDIVVDTTDEQPDDALEESDFNLALKKLTINEGVMVYDDRDLQFFLNLQDLDLTLSGDFTATTTTLRIRNTTVQQVFAKYEGMPLLHDVFVDLHADIDADLEQFAFIFRDNRLRLNDLPVVFDGSFAMPGTDIVLDFNFSSPHSDFRSFLSLVPAIYARNFEGLNTSGEMAFNGHVKGTYNEESIPGFGINLDVVNGMFRYPDLPAAITDIFVNTRISNPGVDADLTVVDVRRFTLNAGGNPVEIQMKLQNPVSDPHIDAFVKGKLDLGTIKNFYPLEEEEELGGIIEANMSARGRMSSIENERYNDFEFTGRFAMQDVLYTSDAFPEGVRITEAQMSLAPQFASLRSFNMQLADSDLSASGRIDNILGFALNDEMLTGSFQTRSEYFDLNQFMQDEPTPEPDEPIELSVIEVPANIGFTLQSQFNRVLFGELVVTNASGAIMVEDQAVKMRNLRMDMLGGSLVMNGSYATPDVQRPLIDFDLDISRFNIQDAFNTFNTFSAIAPLGERASGRFSAGLRLRGSLDEKLQPVLETLAGGGSFSSSSLTIENSPALLALASTIQLDLFRKVDVKNVDAEFSFSNGRVDVKPFTVNLGPAQATVSGNHGFDQTINYLMTMAIPRDVFGGAANQILDNLIARAADSGLAIAPSETVNVGVGFTGTVSNPKVNLTLAQSAEGAREQMQTAIEDAVKEVVDDIKGRGEEVTEDTKDKIREELELRARQVIEQAEQQAQNIRQQAQNAAEAIRQEARNQAQKLEDEASGTIAKTAARRAGEQLIKAADERAAKMEKEADKRAQQLIEDAKQRADSIRAGEE